MNDWLSPNSLIFNEESHSPETSKVGNETGQSCRTISSSGTKFGCGSMQHLKIWRETFLLADLKLLPFVL